MTDPFSAWSQLVSAGLEMQSTWLRGLDTMRASHSVIDARTRMMGKVPDPGDLAEYARMWPEKADAFGRSAQAVTQDALAMQRAWASQVQRMGLMMFGGRVPTFAEAVTFATEATDYSLGAITASAALGKRALAPVHRTATGNARRLKRAKAR